MKYVNAKTILPARLLEELQQYVPGEILYVPGKESARAGWGQANGTREKYMKRNFEIIGLYKKGLRIADIADRYHLTEYSIKKIVSSSKCNGAIDCEVIG